MRYKKISKEDVFNLLVGTSLDFMNQMEGCISIKELSRLLKTSRYQVKKYMDELKRDNLVELRYYLLPITTNYDYELEYRPPYWGYVLTNKGRETSIYKERKIQQEKTIDEWLEK